jgi:hypothetical protein
MKIEIQPIIFKVAFWKDPVVFRHALFLRQDLNFLYRFSRFNKLNHDSSSLILTYFYSAKVDQSTESMPQHDYVLEKLNI